MVPTPSASCLPLAFIADLSSLLCLWLLRCSPLHSVITLTLFTLVLARSGSVGEPRALWSEPDGVLEGDTDWLVGQPVSSIVNRHTDSGCQGRPAWRQASEHTRIATPSRAETFSSGLSLHQVNETHAILSAPLYIFNGKLSLLTNKSFNML